MKLRSSVTMMLAATALSAGLLAGCVVESGPRPRPYGVVEVDVRPPPPRVVVLPAPRRGYVWAPGYWRWNGYEHVWTEGYYVARPRPRAEWISGRWEQRPRGWVYVEGHWN